ncbi:MAG: hypothetical protein ACFCUE_07675 [Candidatus Bathyarchaeia archaeon]|jgi:hypothetical protein
MATESGEPTSNEEKTQEEREKLAEPIQSTDDYFENVNRRLKKKSRFGVGKKDKKESAPKEVPRQEAKVEPPEVSPPPETPKVEEVKTENFEPAPEPQEPVQIVEEPVKVEPEPSIVEAPKEPQPPETDVVEPPQTIENEPQPIPPTVLDDVQLDLPELKVEPAPVKETKPKKKRDFFGFLHRHKEAKPKLSQTSQPIQTEDSIDIQVEPQETLTSAPESPVTETQEPALQELQVNPTEPQAVVEPVLVEPLEDLQVKPVDVEAVGSEQLNAQAPFFDGIVQIGQFTRQDKSRFAEKAVLSVGEYPVHLLLKNRFASRPDGVLPLFIDKSSQDIIKESRNLVNPDFIVGLDAELDAHFWFNILPNVSKDSPFLSRLQAKPISQLRRTLIVSSIWDGVGSALLPTLVSEFNERKICSAALALFPSKVQSLESHFNAFAAVGKCALSSSAPIVLLDRDSIESYLGVDRKGNMINGTKVINYLVDLILSKETSVDEFCEFSKTYDSPIFTLMFGTGASLRVYGSIENILDTLLFKQFLSVDLSSVELIYILTRVPYHLKEKVPRGKIEIAAANWFKDKATLKSIHAAEPVYVEDNSDRIDIALFIGGFNTQKMFSAIEKKVNTMKNRAVKNGYVQEDEWKELVKKLTS